MRVALKVYEEFKNYVQSSEPQKEIEDVVKDIYNFSGHYVNMVLHKETESQLLQGFKDITRLKVDVSYPFLLPVYNDYANGILSKNDFIEAIKYIEHYVF